MLKQRSSFHTSWDRLRNSQVYIGQNEKEQKIKPHIKTILKTKITT